MLMYVRTHHWTIDGSVIDYDMRMKLAQMMIAALLSCDPPYIIAYD